MENADIVVVGSHAPALYIHTNRIPIAGETVIGWDFEEPKDGGKGSNQAIAAARLGAHVAFVGMVGKDRLGNTLYEWFEQEGVDSRWLRQHDSLSTGVGFDILNKDGDCALVTCMGANEGLTTDFIDRAMADFSNSKIMLTQFEIPPEIALHAARRATEYGMISIVNPAPATGSGLNYSGVTILVPNEIEAKTIAGVPVNQKIDSKQLVMMVREKTAIPTIIITLGKDGITALKESEIWQEPAQEVQVVDASGAGDQFCAALAAGLSDLMDIKSACRYAIKAAEISITRNGTIDAFAYQQELARRKD